MSDIYRLAKPRKKGLIHLVFSRFFVIVQLLIVQLLLVISFYGWLKGLLPYFSAMLVVFTLGGVTYLFNSGMDSAAKLTWMFIIAVLPVTGVALLAFTQLSLGHRVIKRRAVELIDQTRDAIPQPEGMLEISPLPANYCKLLEEKGIRAKAFAPIRPVVSTHYNYRDHRKILVIDGKVAFNGGVNLADEYINRIERFGHWKDTAVMLRGDAVRRFTLLFLQMWNITEKEPQFAPFLADTGYVPDRPSGFVIPYGDCPLDGDRVGETVYMDILNRTTDYVHIMTPYLILDGELETALKYAARRGVDVMLILPGIPDKNMAYALAKSHYKRLVEAGVKIYEYTPGFVRAKVFVSDDKKAVVGTINLDYRSLYHHFECATYMYKTACIADIERDFQKTLEKCRRVTPESIRGEKLSYKIMGQLMQFIAPLM